MRKTGDKIKFGMFSNIKIRRIKLLTKTGRP
jgi:hypothetical protein